MAKMTATEITERINKTQEAIAKIEALITKREQALPKAEANLAKTDRSKNEYEWFEAHCKVSDLQEGIRVGKRKLQDKQKTLKTYQERLEKVVEEESKLMEIPEQLQKLREQVAEDLADIEKHFRDRIIADEKRMTYEDFCKRYSGRERYITKYLTDEEIEKEAYHRAKFWVLNLIRRVEDKVGQITKWHLFLADKSLNGWVEGTRGKAVIESIEAGGWNIQCLHTRVLVK